jgi:hypothetical protein
MSAAAEHVHAIQNLKARYCATADRSAHDPEGARAAFADLFTDDVAADYGFGVIEGAAATAEFMCTAVSGNSEWMLHMLHSPLIELGEGSATGHWTVSVHAKRRSDGQVDAYSGRYFDSLRLTAQGWRIAAVQFVQMT